MNERIGVYVGDLTRQNTDAIVNAANSSLLGGGGVDGAIHRAGGGQILEECRLIRAERFPKGLPTGEAVITSGGNLEARYVIHTVGPIFGENDVNDDELLAMAYCNSLRLAAEKGIESIAFPAISTGAFYFPKDRAARIASKAVAEFVRSNFQPREIRLVFLKQNEADVFLRHQTFGESSDAQIFSK